MKDSTTLAQDGGLVPRAESQLASRSAGFASRGLALVETGTLLLRVIEALVLAIDAKDQTSRAHVHRVRLYASELARALNLPEHEIYGLDLAAMLHDIGKVAVSEHILSKPGPLTPEEFQKIRAHPKVGADIISGIPFPYPVSAVILSHHERWDGRGYPAGLKGEEIPLGARILSVVDYFDALMAERPYHRAMSLAQVIGLLRQEAGKGLDPVVVDKFVELLPELQAKAAQLEETMRAPVRNVFDEIALAHREIYALYDIAQGMGTSLGVADTMVLISARLSNLVPFSCAALFLYDEETETLRCRFATGVDAEIIQRVAVRTGEGFTGWVARNRRALMNARPSADFEAAGFAHLKTKLQSALVSPLLFNERLIGTLAVYHVAPAYYRDDHRRLLDHVSEQAAAVINNSILFEQTKEDALTDPLTGLPNVRFLFMHLTRELARANRNKAEMSIMVVRLQDLTGINRSLGRLTADRALCELARILRTSIQTCDVCVRYEGAEFMLVLSGTGSAAAQAKAAELVTSIEQLAFESSAGGRARLRITVGVATYPEDGDRFEQLVASADRRSTGNDGRA